ncbi:MAG TPA: NAD-dependent epimerase/dehydratase family protein [Gemmatimonadaceae bacterium]|nr:NAD-dependent epimerase/dehydratase family protein [Gemmatimonadaceae bacterium]
MKVLVTGGTGVVGQAAVTDLLKRGHTVRLVSRNAAEDARQWPAQTGASAGVEAWPASIGDQTELKGCADGCDLVLHLAGIVEESPPKVTFENTNVEGTRAILREAERAKVGRFIYVSSLGAETGESPYHRSKRRAEDIVRGFAGGWIILRPGNVYGPGDEVVSLLLTMVRTLPVVPFIGTGDDEFQPIWAEDLAAAIAACVDRTDLHGRVLDIAGDEVTSTTDLLNRFVEITGRNPARIPVPGFLASAGATIAGVLGLRLPINENQLIMLSEGNVIRTPGGNALLGVLHIKPTPLDSALRKLADAQPEQTPDEGVGALRRKRFWADIAASKLTPEDLFARLRARFGELTPLHMDVHAEPGAPTVLNKGTTVTMALPVRGNVQVRVEQLTPTKATLVTLSGHPLCGAIRFLSEQRGDLLRFEVQVYDRPANIADWLVMRIAGDQLQGQTWESVVQAMVTESGGRALGPVRTEEEDLDDDQADRVEDWLKELIAERKRSQRSPAETSRKARGNSGAAPSAAESEATL